MSDRIEVTQHELYAMLVSSVCYALGRRSYIVSDACDLVRKYRGHLTVPMLETIRRFIRAELARAQELGNYVGDKMDHEDWTRLLADLETP